MFDDEQESSVFDGDYKGCVKVITLTATQLGHFDAELEKLQRASLREIVDPNIPESYRCSKVRTLYIIGMLLQQSDNGLWARATKVEEVRDVL